MGDLEKRLAQALKHEAEALEQQTATSEILRVIASSPTDVRPVFEAILKRAATLCEAQLGHLWLYEGGEQFRLGAGYGSRPDHLQWLQQGLHRFGRPFFRESGPWRVGQVLDVRDTEPYRRGEPVWIRTADHEGMRTLLAVPLVKDGRLVGSIAVYRREVQPFTDQQTALVQTFADQAVIAIENVRLFKELESRNRDLTDSLEQQTATSEILRVISRSPTDIQPVFDTIVRSAVRLCDGLYGFVSRFDGELIHVAAHHNYTPEGLRALHQMYPIQPGRQLVTGRAILTGAIVHVEDALADPEYAQDFARTGGWRSMLAVPMLRGVSPIGAILVMRAQPGPFPEAQIELLKTFADQAVIAVENVRLFKETKEALDQQTATSEILRVISSSPGDIQPVFDAIAANAARLCDAANGLVIRFDGQLLHLAAHHNVDPERLASLRQAYPRPPSRGALSGRAILTRAVVHVPDVSKDPEYTLPTATTIGYRSVLAVPMMHEGVARGTILVARDVVAPFSDVHIALIQTFADQAVIATENVRLFKELEARTYDLTRSVDELRALGEVGQAISSTLDLQAVLSTIVARATQLSGTDAGVIYEYDAPRKVFLPRATEHLEAEIVETMLATPVRKGEGATGRLAEVQEPVQVPDILTAPAESRVRDALVRAGYRALLAVPLVREDHLLGGLTVIRKTTGAFAPEVIELLRTFATQSALAIQNARLFLEIEEKSRELEAASRHKSEFLANMSHELRTPLNAVIGFSEVLLQRMFGELNAKQDEYLQDIFASGQHLLSLINDILDLSKIEAGRMELELTDFDFPTALDSALTLIRERAGRRGIALHLSVDERLGQLRADERKIRQVVLNLLSNAIKFTPEGGRIEVAAVPRDEFVEVSVSDTGVGIAPEDQEAVFEEFRQVGTAAKKVEGTGLGLALSRKFIELHGGRIWLESRVGIGSTFTFSIPVLRADQVIE